MKSLKHLAVLLVVSAPFARSECIEDTRTKPSTGFLAGLLKSLRHEITPKEQAQMDNEQANVRHESVLYYIANTRCAEPFTRGEGSGPCHVVDRARGCAVLKDLHGEHHFLTIPLRPVTGIEDPSLTSGSAPNDFECAWEHRKVVTTGTTTKFKREDFALGINSLRARSQNQLHIHMGCTLERTKADLAALAPQIKTRWTTIGEPRTGSGRRYLKIERESLNGINPFELLHDDIRARGLSDADMANHALILIGATFADGQPGFYLMDSWQSEKNYEGGPSALYDFGDCPR